MEICCAGTRDPTPQKGSKHQSLSVTIKISHHQMITMRNYQCEIFIFMAFLGSPSLFGRAVVIVSIVNRATPVFTQPFYGVVSVLEDAQPHTVVTDVVKASSPDGSIIYYTIEQGDPLQQFDIDFTTGTMLLTTLNLT